VDHDTGSQDQARGSLDLLSVVLLVGGMTCFGSATPVSAIVGRGFPSWMASALRMAMAAAILIPIYLAAQRRGSEPGPARAWRSLDGHDRLLLVGIAAIGTFGFSILMVVGMRNAPGAVAAVVMATTPAVTAIGAVLFLRDRLDRWRTLAVVLAVGGVVVTNLGAEVAEGSGGRVVLGSALVFGAVLCEASYTLMGKRLSADLSPLAMVTAASVLAVGLFAPLAVRDAVGFDWSRPTGGQWLAAAWWGAGTMALGSWLWFWGMSRVPAGTAAPFMGVMPVSALVLSYLLLGEPFQWIHAMGMAIVLAGLGLVIRSGASLH
jgi:drug/metabolite transporter (DMT)-like permease